MIQAANGAVKKKKTFYHSKYNRLRFKLGSANKAKVAIANRMARSVYKVLGGENYKELGYARGNPRNERRVKQVIAQLKNMGMSVRYESEEVVVKETHKIYSNGLAAS